MSITSENASYGGGSSTSSLKGRDPRSPAVIAEFNKRRLHGDFGTQPNAPSLGINIEHDASSSAIRAASSRSLGPKLWHPSSSNQALRASTLASSSSSSFIPDAHYVEDKHSSSLASKAATSAIQVSGEEYGAKHQPEAYKWGKQQSQWSHLGAARSAAAAQRDEERLTGINSLNRPPATHSIDISKVLTAAQANATSRLAAADNHLPSGFGIQTEEQKAERRQQVLSLISIADQRVKARMAEMNRDIATPQNVFGSIEFQKIALDVATKTHSGRLDNHGKLNLGGGLYMTQDEVDDIARRHVQPVLDKVQLVADKKRIADREAAEREAAAKQQREELKALEAQRKAEEKQRKAEEKQQKRAAEAAAKHKRERAEARTKEQHPQGSHLWHWQQVELIKEEVKDAKTERDAKTAEVSRLQKSRETTKSDLDATIERHHELKSDYFGRGEQIETKQGEYDADAPETASLFELRQQRETVKANTKIAKTKRTELEERLAFLDRQIADSEKDAEQLTQRHHDLKKKYFEAKAEAEEAEKKFQAEEEARLKREAEECQKREAEEAERRKREAEEEERRKASAATAASASASTGAGAGTGKKADKKKGTAGAAPTPGGGSSANASKSASASNTDTELGPVKLPPKSQLLGLGDAKSGPILSGYKQNKPAEKHTEAVSKSAETEATPALPKSEDSEGAKGDSKVVEPAAKSAAVDPLTGSEKVAGAPSSEPSSSSAGAAAGAGATNLTGATATADADKAAGENQKAAGVALDAPSKSELLDKLETSEAGDSKATAGAADIESKATKGPSAPVVATGPIETLREGPQSDALPASQSSQDATLAESSGKARTYEDVIRDEEARARATKEKVSSHGSDTFEKNNGFDSSKVEGATLTINENTAIKGAAPGQESIPNEAQTIAVGGDVAGSVAAGEKKLSSDIPLSEPKDQFSGFDSSNVKEKVEDASRGVFKEDL